MNTLDLVESFHWQFSYRFPTPENPALDAECCALRINLLREELMGKGELWDSITAGDRHGILDGLCDFQYVLSGAVLALGLRNLFELSMAAGILRHAPFLPPALIIQLKVEQIEVAIDRLENMLYAKQIPMSVECLTRIQLLFNSLIKSLDFERVFEGAFLKTHENNMGKLWSEEDVGEYLNAEIFVGEGGSYELAIKNRYRFEPSGDKYIARRYDGKIAKPPSHKPVDLSEFVTI